MRTVIVLAVLRWVSSTSTTARAKAIRIIIKLSSIRIPMTATDLLIEVAQMAVTVEKKAKIDVEMEIMYKRMIRMLMTFSIHLEVVLVQLWWEESAFKLLRTTKGTLLDINLLAVLEMAGSLDLQSLAKIKILIIR